MLHCLCEKARIWELIEPEFNANRAPEDHFTIEQMQGQYKWYRLEKKKKFEITVSFTPCT